MYIAFKHLHSFIAYLSLAFLIFAVGYTFYSLIKNSVFTKKSKTIAILGLIGAHTQILLGFVLYFLSPLGISNFSGEMMKNSTSRLYALEHPLMMFVAILLITIGYSKAKRLPDDKNKFKKIAIFYSLGLLAILSRIPWDAWIG